MAALRRTCRIPPYELPRPHLQGSQCAQALPPFLPTRELPPDCPFRSPAVPGDILTIFRMSIGTRQPLHGLLDDGIVTFLPVRLICTPPALSCLLFQVRGALHLLTLPAADPRRFQWARFTPYTTVCCASDPLPFPGALPEPPPDLLTPDARCALTPCPFGLPFA